MVNLPHVTFIVVEIVFGAFVILCLVYTILLHSVTEDKNPTYFKYLYDSWKYGPIEKIASNDCELIRNKFPLISDQWAGTVKGCINSNNISNKSCGKYGRTINATGPISYNYWKETKLCAQRNSTNYLQLPIFESEESCPKGYRSCGVVDTSNNVLCREKKSPCPINYLEIIPKDQVFPQGFDFNSIELSDSYLITSDINTKDFIINSLLIDENQPCADPSYKNYHEPPYILEIYYNKSRCFTKLGGYYLDPSPILKDYDLFSNIYERNHIFHSLTNLTVAHKENYPFFSESMQKYINQIKKSDRTLKMYHKPYVGLRLTCLNKIKMNNLSEKIMLLLHNIDSIYSNSMILLTGALIVQSTLVCIHFFSYILMCLEWNNKREYWKGKSATYFLDFFITISLIILLGVVCSRFGEIQSIYFLTDKSNNCFYDEILKEGLSKSILNLQQIDYYTISSLTFSCLSLFFNIPLGIISFMVHNKGNYGD